MLGKLVRELISLRRSAAAPNPASTFASGPATGARVIDLDEVNSLVAGRHGWLLANRYDLYLGAALVDYGEYAEEECRFLLSFLRKGDMVVEVGANIGAHTIALAKALAPTGGVIAIEPQAAIFRVLCANLALNNIQNAQALNCGCGAGRETMRVSFRDYQKPELHNSGSASLSLSGEGVAVEVAPLDELVADIDSLRLLKIDVEGMEREVLQGAGGLIERFRPLLYVENDRVEKSSDLIAHLLGLGYRLWWHEPLLYSADNWFGQEQNAWGNTYSLNMICAPAQTPPPPQCEALEEITNSEQLHSLMRREAG